MIDTDGTTSNRRLRRRRLWVVLGSAAAVLVFAIPLLVYMLVGRNETTSTTAPVPGASPPAATAPAGGPTVGQSPSSGATARPMPSAQPAVRHCQAADLTVNSIESGGAAGRIGYTTVVTNTGGRPCALLGDHVVLVYRSASGTIVTVPTTSSAGDAPARRTLGRGERAAMTLLIVNGYGGYDPSSPACANPVVYRNLSVRFSQGGSLSLNGLVLDVKCDGIVAYDWFAPTGAA
jgi:hypothetical protein